MLLSIITVTWNNLAGLKKTASSINSQTARESIQWVVIDGNSSDGSVEFVKRQQTEGDYFVSEKDKGLYDAMNKGIQAAKGNFLWFLNAGDTLYENTTVEKTLPFLENNDLVYGETLLVEPDGTPIGTRSEKTTRKLPAQLNLQSMLGGMVVNHQSVLVRKGFCPTFDLKWKIAADYDWLCRVLAKAKTRKNTGLIHSCFEVGGLSSQKVKASWKERFLIMQKHFGFWKAVWAHLTIVRRVVLKRVYL